MQFQQDCPVAPVPDPLTNGALVQYSLDLRDSLLECNADKAALRAWATSIPKE